MEDYVGEAPKQGYIEPPTLPTSARFFLVEKIGCIDYRGLDNITVKYPYTLPLVLSAQQLC